MTAAMVWPPANPSGVEIFIMSLYYPVKFHVVQVLTNHEYILQNKYRIINLLRGT